MSVPSSEIKQVIDVLKNGGVVVMPTETSYGLMADATNTRAVKKALAIKGRGPANPPPLIASDRTMADDYINLPEPLAVLGTKFWPGPLSLVAQHRRGLGLSSAARKPDGTIALRVTSHPLLKRIIKAVGKPLIATSANRSGQPDCYSISRWRKQYAKQPLQPDMILDVGSLPRRKPSTIVGEKDGELIIYRQGPIRIPKKYVA